MVYSRLRLPPVLLGRALLIWLVFGAVAVLTGTLREAFLRPVLSELQAHQIGTVAVCAVMAGLIVVFVRWTRLTEAQAWVIGSIWIVLTMLLEFGLFHYVFHVPWSRLLADYNVTEGRLWPLVLLTELTLPYIVVRTQGASRAPVFE